MSHVRAPYVIEKVYVFPVDPDCFAERLIGEKAAGIDEVTLAELLLGIPRVREADYSGHGGPNVVVTIDLQDIESEGTEEVVLVECSRTIDRYLDLGV